MTRWLLYLLVASIAAGSSLAIILMLIGDWTWFDRTLLTAVVLATGTVIAMACASPLSRGRSRPPLVGIGLSGLATSLLIVGIWAEVNDTGYWNASASVLILAMASGHTSLVSLARPAPSHRWVQVAAYAATFLFAGVLVGLIHDRLVDETAYRLLGVLGILGAGFTLLVPIFQFLDRPRNARGIRLTDIAALDAEIERLEARLGELRETRRASNEPTRPR